MYAYYFPQIRFVEPINSFLQYESFMIFHKKYIGLRTLPCYSIDILHISEIFCMNEMFAWSLSVNLIGRNFLCIRRTIVYQIPSKASLSDFI